MKKLNLFTYFDWKAFAKDKRFISTGIEPLKDFNSGKRIGTKVESVIAQDDTDYGNAKGEVINNLYEKVTFKIKGNVDVDVPMNVEIRPVNVTATVYGEYRNQLSITAEKIEVLSK